MRIGLKKNIYKKIHKQQYAHTKSVARLVDRENWSKKNILQKEQNKTIRSHKSVARLVDSENWFTKICFAKNNNNTRTKKVLLD